MKKELFRYAWFCCLFAAFTSVSAGTLNGFDVGPDALIPVDEIHSGGPPRDGIPALDKPIFIAADRAGDLTGQDPVLGLSYKGIVRAYPIAIMNWHEIVNDRFGDDPVVVTYCPLCGSGVAFAGQVKGRELTMGVSGLLYNSDVLLFDRQTQSLWSQMLSRAVSGPMRGSTLTMLPLTHTTWAEWRAEHPTTLVLSRETGFQRDYHRDPYAGYVDSTGVWFPVARKDPRYHPKEKVLGVELGGRFKAYPFAELSKLTGPVRDRFAGQDLTVEYNPKGNSARAFDSQGNEMTAVISFWFAWYAFHPDTEVYQSD